MTIDENPVILGTRFMKARMNPAVTKSIATQGHEGTSIDENPVILGTKNMKIKKFLIVSQMSCLNRSSYQL